MPSPDDRFDALLEAMLTKPPHELPPESVDWVVSEYLDAILAETPDQDLPPLGSSQRLDRQLTPPVRCGGVFFCPINNPHFSDDGG